MKLASQDSGQCSSISPASSNSLSVDGCDAWTSSNRYEEQTNPHHKPQVYLLKTHQDSLLLYSLFYWNAQQHLGGKNKSSCDLWLKPNHWKHPN